MVKQKRIQNLILLTTMLSLLAFTPAHARAGKSFQGDFWSRLKAVIERVVEDVKEKIKKKVQKTTVTAVDENGDAVRGASVEVRLPGATTWMSVGKTKSNGTWSRYLAVSGDAYTFRLSTDTVTVESEWIVSSTGENELSVLLPSETYGYEDPEPTNNAPVILDSYPEAAVSITYSSTQAFSVTAGDEDAGDVLTYTWTVDGEAVDETTNTYLTFGGSLGTQTIAVTVADGNGASVSYEWTATTVAGSTSGTPVYSPADFDGDGKRDLLWHNQVTGEVQIWLMDGATRVGQYGLGTITDPWKILGLGDFDGNGTPDIIWRNADSGLLFIWFRDGMSTISMGSIAPPSANWECSAIADLDGDGMADLVWLNRTSGLLYGWLMNGTSQKEVALIRPVNADCTVRAARDYNNDGTADLLIEDPTAGVLYLATMNGTTVLAKTDVSSLISGWSIFSLHDLDGNGTPDIVWERESDSFRYVWFMDGTDVIGMVDTPSCGAQWVSQANGVGDSDGNGTDDQLWLNSETGMVYLWLMDGRLMTSVKLVTNSMDLTWSMF